MIFLKKGTEKIELVARPGDVILLLDHDVDVCVELRIGEQNLGHVNNLPELVERSAAEHFPKLLVVMNNKINLHFSWHSVSVFGRTGHIAIICKKNGLKN